MSWLFHFLKKVLFQVTKAASLNLTQDPDKVWELIHGYFYVTNIQHNEIYTFFFLTLSYIVVNFRFRVQATFLSLTIFLIAMLARILLVSINSIHYLHHHQTFVLKLEIFHHFLVSRCFGWYNFLDYLWFGKVWSTCYGKWWILL